MKFIFSLLYWLFCQWLTAEVIFVQLAGKNLQQTELKAKAECLQIWQKKNIKRLQNVNFPYAESFTTPDNIKEKVWASLQAKTKRTGTEYEVEVFLETSAADAIFNFVFAEKCSEYEKDAKSGVLFAFSPEALKKTVILLDGVVNPAQAEKAKGYFTTLQKRLQLFNAKFELEYPAVVFLKENQPQTVTIRASLANYSLPALPLEFSPGSREYVTDTDGHIRCTVTRDMTGETSLNAWVRRNVKISQKSMLAPLLEEAFPKNSINIVCRNIALRRAYFRSVLPPSSLYEKYLLQEGYIWGDSTSNYCLKEEFAVLEKGRSRITGFYAVQKGYLTLSEGDSLLSRWHCREVKSFSAESVADAEKKGRLVLRRHLEKNF